MYEDEGYTGFLPVNLTIHPPNFVHQWGIEDNQGQISLQSLPINLNGVFKFYYNSGQLGPFALGYIPVKRYNSSTEDFDFSVNIPETLIYLEPDQTISISHNKRRKVFTLYDDNADDDMDIEEVSDNPLQQQQQRSILKIRDVNSNNNDTSYRNIGNFTIDVDIPIYEGYDQSNPYTISQNGSGVISIPQNYEGLGEINYDVNVTPNNADVDSQNNNEITQNGTYTIPNGYSGWNNFSVNVPSITLPEWDINKFKLYGVLYRQGGPNYIVKWFDKSSTTPMTILKNDTNQNIQLSRYTPYLQEINNHVIIGISTYIPPGAYYSDNEWDVGSTTPVTYLNNSYDGKTISSAFVQDTVSVVLATFFGKLINVPE